VKRPDGEWSVLLVNRDAAKPRTVQLRFAGNPNAAVITGLHDEWLFSREEYRWIPDGENGHSGPDHPPRHQKTRAERINLPPYSIAVVRGSH
jgi:hypothetical protein